LHARKVALIDPADLSSLALCLQERVLAEVHQLLQTAEEQPLPLNCQPFISADTAICAFLKDEDSTSVSKASKQSFPTAGLAFYTT